MIRNSIFVAGSLFLLSCASAGQAQDTDRLVQDIPCTRQAASMTEQNALLPKIRRADFWEKGRPADLYELGYVRTGEQVICTRILEALNEPRPWPEGIKLGHFAGWVDTLTGNKYEVEWVDTGGGNTLAPTTSAYVDFDNDGILDAVHRYSTSISSKNFQYLVATTILPSQADAAAEALLFDSSHDENGKFKPKNIILKSEYVDYENYVPISDSNFWSQAQFKNILVIGNRNVVLSGGSYQHKPGKENPYPMRIYQPLGSERHKFLCEVKYRYQF